MEKITIFNRSTKTDGSIRIRFRLRDGRNVDLYHKSEINAALADLEKFDPDGRVKKKITIYNRDLESAILSEIAIMHQAYSTMTARGMAIDGATFERMIDQIKHPEAYNGKAIGSDLILDQFDGFIEAGLRDGLFGEARARHYRVMHRILQRFLTIYHLQDLKVQDLDAEILMQLRQFIADEYRFVDDWRQLYIGQKESDVPKESRSANTIAMKMKMMQAFFNEMENQEIIEKSPFRKLGRERRRNVMRERYDDPIYLYSSELKSIMAATDLPDRLIEARDAFLVQCAFGCRIGDFASLSMANVSVDKNGIPFIHYLPEKTKHTQITNAEIETPIMLFAFDIIKKYDFKFACTRYAYGENGYNAKIKEILKHCGINRTCASFDEEAGTNVYLPIYEFGSSKLARKTHIDLMNKVQVNKYVAGLHKAGSHAVDRYTQLEMKDHFALMCAAFDQPEYRVDQDLNVIE